MDLGVPELLIVLVIVILFFGSGRLVKLGHELGTGIRQFREGIKDKDEVQETLEPSPVENQEI